MQNHIDLSWLDEFAAAANTDQELTVIGQHFCNTITLCFGSERIALKVSKGKVEDIIRDPGFDINADFGFTAPTTVWSKFFKPVPPPLFHDFFAMVMRVPEFVLEGSGLAAMQNARALSRLMYILRDTGAKHV